MKELAGVRKLGKKPTKQVLVFLGKKQTQQLCVSIFTKIPTQLE